MKYRIRNANNYHQQFRQSGTTEFLLNTLIIVLDTTAQNFIKQFYFGMSHWLVLNQLDSLAASINLIEIKTAKLETLFSTQTSIKQFFEERLKGRQDESIEIIID